MSLETASHINQLVATNPTGGDPKDQGDDHLRLIKTVLLTDLLNIGGVVYSSHIELNYVNAVTPGTAAASKAVVLGASSDVTGLGAVTSTGTITAATFSGPLTGNVTGNCSGSSGSCTGNSATATTATTANSVAAGVINNAAMAANAIYDAQVYWENISSSSQVVPGGTSWTPSAGLYTMTVNNTLFKIQIGVNVGSAPWVGGTLYCDGTNVTITNTDTNSATVYYIKLA